MQASVPLRDRLAAIRQELAEAQQQLLQTLARVGPTDWSRSGPRNPGWTIHQLLAHLSTAENGFLPTLQRLAAGQGGVPADFDPNRWNAGQLRRRADSPPEQLRIELEGAHAAMLTLLEGLDDAALDQRGHLTTGHEGSTEDCFRLVASHKRAHTQDIQAALA